MVKVKKILTAIGKAVLKTVADFKSHFVFFKSFYEEYVSFPAKEGTEKV